MKITGDDDPDELTGTPEDDEIDGRGGSDILDGLGGDDRLFGRSGADSLYGRAGADFLYGGAGPDLLSGGSGDDSYVVDGQGDSVEESVGGGDDRVYAGSSYILVTGSHVETLSTLSVTSTDAIDLHGNECDNYLSGNAGLNRLKGGPGDDRMTALAGDDVLDGGAGADVMHGGDGSDHFTIDDAGDRVVELRGGGAGDRVSTRVSYALEGDSHVETLEAADANAVTAIALRGNRLNNAILADAGGNVLAGNGGNDFLSARAGDDSLSGGTGNDRMAGGAGADRFYFNTAPNGATNRDDILDFASADDSIYLRRSVFAGIASQGALAADSFHAGPSAADAGDRIVYDSPTGRIFYDADGSGAAAAILFARVDPGTALTSADFVVYG